jgi:hypothetical protein
MYPSLYSHPSAPPPPYYADDGNNKRNNPNDQFDNRNYHIPSEQRMVSFEKFVRRYESMCVFRLKITI